MVYIAVSNSYYNVSLKQSISVSNHLLEIADMKLSIFANKLYKLTKTIYTDRNIVEILEECNYTETVTQKNENKLKKSLQDYLYKNPSIKSIRLYVNNYPIHILRQNYALNQDHFIESKWYKQTIERNGEITQIPTTKTKYIVTKSNNVITTHENIISFSKLIKDEVNRQLAIIVFDYEETYISTLYEHLMLAPSSIILISSKEGEILSSTNKKIIESKISSIINLDRFGDGNSIVETIGSKKYFINKRHFYILNWDVYSITPYKDLFLDKQAFNNILGKIFLLFIVANIVLTIIMSNMISKPIKNLLEGIKQAKKGNFNKRIQVLFDDEIGEVGEQFNEMIDSIQKLLNENYIIKIREKEAQLKSLQAQINPHFLYNTLDTISSIVMIESGKDVSKIMKALGHIMRYSISKSNKTVTLKEEVEQIKNYLFIQQIRYEDRFKYYIEIDEKILNAQMHKLLIQPLVENAIVHGLDEKYENGVLYIKGSIINDDLYIEVFDNGSGIEKKILNNLLLSDDLSLNNDSLGIGVCNVNNRIKYYYGSKYGLQIESKVGVYTKIILKIPYFKK